MIRRAWLAVVLAAGVGGGCVGREGLLGPGGEGSAGGVRVARFAVGPVAPRMVAFMPGRSGDGALLVLVASGRAGFVLADVPEAALTTSGER